MSQTIRQRAALAPRTRKEAGIPGALDTKRPSEDFLAMLRAEMEQAPTLGGFVAILICALLGWLSIAAVVAAW